MRPVLSQNLNMISLSYGQNNEKPLCFDNFSDDIIYFEIEETNNGRIKLKFRKSVTTSESENSKYTYHYVGVCDKVCTQIDTMYKRLCVRDKNDAIIFNIELIPQPINTSPTSEIIGTSETDVLPLEADTAEESEII